MKKSLLTTLAAALAFQVHAQTYTPVTLTGFNADVIANGSGAAMTSTTHDMDGIMVLAAQNYVSPSNQTPAANTALPNTGLITSLVTTTPGLTFQLAPYTGNNVLRVASNTSGTLTFATPVSTTDLYLLLTPVNYSGTMPVTFTVNFTDGTNQVFSGTTITYNWYISSGFAWGGTTRVNRSTSALDVQAVGPRMFQHKLTMSAANATKSIQSILVNNGSAASTNNMLHVMGVTALTPASTLATDAGVIAVTAPNSGCALTNAETITVTIKNFGTTALSNFPVSYKINGGGAISETYTNTIPANSTVNYSFTTKANLSTVGTYAIEARTNLIGDLLATNDALTKNVILSAAPAVPTITAGGPTTFCTGGSVTLTAASTTTGATFQWFNNGTAINGATSATYTANAAGSYTVTAALNGCAGSASAATVVTVNTKPAAPSIGVSGATNFCAGGSVTLTALAGVTGATFSWFQNGNLIPNTNASTYVAMIPGNYTVSASLNGCNSPVSSPTSVTVKPGPAMPTITRAGMQLTSSSLSGNQWYKDGTILTGQTARTYIATANGSYTVTASANGCTSTPSSPVSITNTGMNDDESNLAVTVFPNPSTGVFNISLAKGEQFELVVTDLSGKVISKQKATKGAAQLNLQKAAKGIYLLQVSGEKGSAIRKLIVE